MSEQKSESEIFGKALVIAGVIIVSFVIVAAAFFALGQWTAPHAAGTVAPAPQPTATVAIPSPYPYVLTFTVLSTTTSNGAYEIFTTTGQHIYVQDYYTWENMRPRDVYTGTITGQNGAAFIMVDVHLMSSSQWTYQPSDYWQPYGNSMYDDHRSGRSDRSNRVDTHQKLRW
jgi:hypothetical protein